ncbi:MAG: hypothetical protein ABF255_16590 [Planktotalea arctica]|uniref:hypothetical protein n=1 Tax=Planktotalea arctica TaxID=1481893 RepID=UPI00321BE2CF
MTKTELDVTTTGLGVASIADFAAAALVNVLDCTRAAVFFAAGFVADFVVFFSEAVCNVLDFTMSFYLLSLNWKQTIKKTGLHLAVLSPSRHASAVLPHNTARVLQWFSARI